MPTKILAAAHGTVLNVLGVEHVIRLRLSDFKVAAICGRRGIRFV